MLWYIHFTIYREGVMNLNRLKEIREQKKISMSKLAKLSGITRQTIARLENEEEDSANSKTLKALADALGVNMSEFFMD